MFYLYKSVLLFGAPGVGKGTQGKTLGNIGGFYHCASGDIFRSVDPESDLGKIFFDYSSRGELVPDDVTVKMWQDAISTRIKTNDYLPTTDLLVLDGIPRTIEQARIMDDLIDVLSIAHLVCQDREAMVGRLRRRALKQNRHDDADEAVIRNRWDVYERESAPVLEHYPKHLIVEVDAVGTPAQVLRHLLEVVEPIQSNYFAAFEG